MQDELEDSLMREALQWFVKLRDPSLPEAERRLRRVAGPQP